MHVPGLAHSYGRLGFDWSYSVVFGSRGVGEELFYYWVYYCLICIFSVTDADAIADYANAALCY